MTEHLSRACDKVESGGDTRIAIGECVETHAWFPPWKAGERYQLKATTQPCVARVGAYVLRVERGWELVADCLNVGPDDRRVYAITLKHQVPA